MGCPKALPEKTFSATVEASATAWEGRVARARFRNFGAGSWPVGLPETSFRATAEASATAMANPRRRSRALRYSGAGGWPVGLPETIFRATAKASALALASVVLALGAGRTGFPKQVSERRKAEGCWTASGRNGRLINQKQISKFGLRMADFILSRIRSLSAVKPSHFYQGLAELQFYQGRPAAVAVLSRRVARARFRNFGAGSWPVGLLETIFRAILARAPLFQRSGLARRASRNNFPGDGQLLRQPPSRSLPLFWRWGVAGRASRNKFPSDESGGILERQWPQWPFYQPERTSGQIFKFGLGMADFILSRIRSLSAAKQSHFYQGLAEGQLYQGRPAEVAVYQSRWQFYQGRPACCRFINNGRFFKIEDQASGRNGRFINQKCRICRFRLRMVDFILSRASSLSTATSFRRSTSPKSAEGRTGDLKNVKNHEFLKVGGPKPRQGHEKPLAK